MHNGLSGLKSAIVLGSMIVVAGWAGCSANDQEGACSNVTPCGGDLVGDWAVKSSCLRFAGTVDMTRFGLDCTSGSLWGSLQVLANGKWTATPDGRFMDGTHNKGTQTFTLPDACLNVFGTTTTCEALGVVIQGGGFQTVSCKDPYYTPRSMSYGGKEKELDGGTPPSGLGCTCQANVDYFGGMGFITSDPPVNSTYTTSNNELTVSAGGIDYKYSYCVQGNKLTLSPQKTFVDVAGSIILEKQ
jgi:hypothetical protein